MPNISLKFGTLIMFGAIRNVKPIGDVHITNEINRDVSMNTPRQNAIINFP